MITLLRKFGSLLFFFLYPLFKYRSSTLQLSHYTSSIYTMFLPQIRSLVINLIIYLSSYCPVKMTKKLRMIKNRYTSIVYQTGTMIAGAPRGAPGNQGQANGGNFFFGGGGQSSARYIGLRKERRDGSLTCFDMKF